jgi:hypothetical protein
MRPFLATDGDTQLHIRGEKLHHYDFVSATDEEREVLKAHGYHLCLGRDTISTACFAVVARVLLGSHMSLEEGLDSIGLAPEDVDEEEILEHLAVLGIRTCDCGCWYIPYLMGCPCSAPEFPECSEN